jgi:hypothetical protein
LAQSRQGLGGPNHHRWPDKARRLFQGRNRSRKGLRPRRKNISRPIRRPKLHRINVLSLRGGCYATDVAIYFIIQQALFNIFSLLPSSIFRPLSLYVHHPSSLVHRLLLYSSTHSPIYSSTHSLIHASTHTPISSHWPRVTGHEPRATGHGSLTIKIFIYSQKGFSVCGYLYNQRKILIKSKIQHHSISVEF